jgi:hypothetical protein
MATDPVIGPVNGPVNKKPAKRNKAPAPAQRAHTRKARPAGSRAPAPPHRAKPSPPKKNTDRIRVRVMRPHMISRKGK